jgi:hypothetical protein
MGTLTRAATVKSAAAAVTSNASLVKLERMGEKVTATRAAETVPHHCALPSASLAFGVPLITEYIIM